MSLWISSHGEDDRGLPPPQGGGGAPQSVSGRSLYSYVLAGLIGLIAGLVLGQIFTAHRMTQSRIQWPAPVLPHPRTLPP
jgi:hypothetical protein